MPEFSLDIQTFFLVGLSGFMAVWTFRYFRNSEKTLSDFEYVGFSAFWGLIILLATGWVMRHDSKAFDDMVANPFAAGLPLSFIGMLFAFAGGWLTKRGSGARIQDLVDRVVKSIYRRGCS